MITLAGLENTREHNTVDLLAYHEMLGNLVQGFLLLQSRRLRNQSGPHDIITGDNLKGKVIFFISLCYACPVHGL